MKKLVAFALVLLVPVSVQAIPITHPTLGAFDVTYSETTGANPALSTQPWWASESLAGQFATLLNDDFGFPNVDFFGPLFAFASDVTGTSVVAWTREGEAAPGFLPSDLPTNYALATPIRGNVPEPGSLALLISGLVGMVLLRRPSRHS